MTDAKSSDDTRTERAAELIAVECPGDCEYTAQIARGTLSIATCPGCDRELKIDTDKWVHRCPETAADMVVSARDNDCPYCNRGVGDV